MADTKNGLFLCVDDESIVTESLRSLFYKSLKDVGVIEVAHSAEEAMVKFFV